MKGNGGKTAGILDRGKTAVIFDRNPLSLDAVEGLLERVGVTVEGATTSPADALKMVEEPQPTVFVTEYDGIQQSEDGLASLNRVTAVNPDVHTVVLSTQDDPGPIEAFAAGASVYCVGEDAVGDRADGQVPPVETSTASSASPTVRKPADGHRSTVCSRPSRTRGGRRLNGRFLRLEQQPQRRDLDEAECVQCDRHRQSRLERHDAVLLARVLINPVATAASPRLG